MDGTQVIQLPPLSIRAAFTPKTVNDQDRTVELIFSTGAPVERYDWQSGARYLEKLSLDPAHVRIGRLNEGGPVLNTHKMEKVADVIGAVVPGSVTLHPTAAKATVRFSRRPEVEEVWRDVQEGIVKSVSVGYRTYRYEETPARANALLTRTAVDWEPFEISMVPIPADAGAKVRTGAAAMVNRCVVIRAGGASVGGCPICGGAGSLGEHWRCFEPSAQDGSAHFGEPWLL
jgi:hypothetical protein